MLIGGNTKSRTLAYPNSTPSTCLTKPVAFFRRYDVAHNTGVMTLNKEMVFTQQIVVNSVLCYFSGVLAVKWDFTNTTHDINYYTVIVKVSQSVDDAQTGNIGIIFRRSTNEILKTFYLPSTKLKPDSSMVYFAKAIKYMIWLCESIKSNPNTVSLIPRFVVYNLDPSGQTNMDFLFWNFTSSIGITACYVDYHFRGLATVMHLNNDPANTAEQIAYVYPGGTFRVQYNA